MSHDVTYDAEEMMTWIGQLIAHGPRRPGSPADRAAEELLERQLKEFGLEVPIIDKDLGYELRCADPIPFDAEYTRE